MVDTNILDKRNFIFEYAWLFRSLLYVLTLLYVALPSKDLHYNMLVPLPLLYTNH